MKISDFIYLKVQRTIYICRTGENVFKPGTAYRKIFFDKLFKAE